MLKANNKGFSLVEMVVVMAIFVIVMLLIANSFETIIGKSGQQLKSAATNTEGIVGLEMLRADLEHAGFGLPWSLANPPASAFPEATASPVTGISSPGFNEVTPRAFQVGTAPSGGTKIIEGPANSTNPGSAYLVLKATNVAPNATGKKWSYVTYQSTGIANTSYVTPWPTATDNFAAGDRVITIVSTFSDTGEPDKRLVMDPTATPARFSYSMSGVPSSLSGSQVQPLSDVFKPADASQLVLVYGVDGRDLRMPYNRADYYVKKPARPPTSCNPGTGTLFKGVVRQDDGEFLEYPLLNCVGDMQVEFELDRNGDGNITYSPTLTAGNGTTPLGAAEIRNQLKNVRVYLLSHEGKKDNSYAYGGGAIQVGDPARPSSSGRTWDTASLAATFGADWQKYRWKVYTIVVHPKNLD